MIVNDKIIYRSAVDDLFYVEGVAFEDKDAAIWYANTGNIPSAEELKEMTKKEKFVIATRAMMTMLAQQKDEMPVLEEIWSDRQYLTNISADDLAAMNQDITTAQLAAGITLIQQQILFYSNQVAVQGDYGATLSGLRTDK